MLVICLHVFCLCTTLFVPGALRAQKMVECSHGQLVVSHHVGAGNQTQVLCKNNKGS